MLERFVVRRADANITPNDNWTREFQLMGARNAFTYHDFLEKRVASSRKSESRIRDRLPSHRFLVIAAHGGHPEELLEEEVAAVDGLDGYLLVITGRPEKLGQRVAKIKQTPNATFAGYLSSPDYEALKIQADVALSLSEEPNTVPHAVHEFLSYGIPTIVVKDDLLRSIFNGAIIEAENSKPESIRNKIRRACEDMAYRETILHNIDSNYTTRAAKHATEIAELRRVL